MNAYEYYEALKSRRVAEELALASAASSESVARIKARLRNIHALMMEYREKHHHYVSVSCYCLK